MPRCIPALLAVVVVGCQPPQLHTPANVDPALTAIAGPILAGDLEDARRRADLRGVHLREGGDETALAVILELRDGVEPHSLRASELARRGATLEAVSRSWARAAVQPDRLGDLAGHPDIRLVRAPAWHLPTDYGSTVSQAVGLTGADDLIDAGHTGAGVKVAVADGGFEGLTEAIDDHGELPDTTVAYQGNTLLSWADIEIIDPHGVGVAEHVLDMAPGVDLYCILIEDEVDFQNAAALAASEGIHIVNHSMAWFGMSYYDDSGPISGVVNDSRDLDDVFWAASAGNGAAGHWRGGWADGGDGLLDWDGSDHEMQLTSDSYQISLVLNWDQYATADTDLDLFLYASDGTLVASSEYDQPTYVPAEGISVAFDGNDSPYQVVVQYMDGPTQDLDITLSSYYNHVEYADAASSLVEPAEGHGAFAVGAVDQGGWDDASPAVTDYSAQGPTHDGRLKPDIVAPDGTQSWTYGASHGTSFASPTTAGAAALLAEADPGLDAIGLAHTLRALSEDQGDSGWDNTFGAGQLHLDVDVCIDEDADGYGSGAFGNVTCGIADVDCDDTRDDVYPGATDDWYDGIDSDCDGESDYDADGDGHDSDQYWGDDCDDSDGSVYPGATDDWYDGIDSDCDGESDHDADGDGFDSDQYEGEDCADDDADVHPDQVEDCGDGIDNDCDGLMDLDDEECATGDDDDSAAGDDDDDDVADDDDDDVTPGDDDDSTAADDDAAVDDNGEAGCACRTDGARGTAVTTGLLMLMALVGSLRRR